jgi:exodeoxyribonuclease V alpha subunit
LIFSGTVSSVLYENEDFRILRVVLDGGNAYETTVVKGNFPAQEVAPGTWVTFAGKWVEHSKYGKQLQVERSPVSLNHWTDESVLAALTAQGVGPTTRVALQIHAKKKGLELSDILDSGDLSEIAVLDEFTQTHTLVKWRSLRTHMDAAAFLGAANIPPEVVGKIWKTFGTEAQEKILQDPWVLVQVAGISFKEADEIALRMGVDLDNPGRVRGAVLAAVQEYVSEGHVFATTHQVVAWVGSKIPGIVPPIKIAEAIRDLKASDLLIVDREVSPGVTALYDPWVHQVESQCATLLRERVSDESHLKVALSNVGDRVRDQFEGGASLEEMASAALENWALASKATLTQDQHRAAVGALTAPVFLLTGLPGTGKTTTLLAAVSILKDMGVPLLLVAPTGIAAKRMSSVTGFEASTIHRAFGAQNFLTEGSDREASYVGVLGESGGQKKAQGESEKETWGYGPGRHHPARVVIVDESSMLDLNMLYRLLSGTSPECRIIFVGDPYQLPSVGAGDVLRDLVESKVFPHTHLSQIFRQEGTSGIVTAAHEVHAGRTPKSDGKDFVLLPAESEEEASKLVVDLSKKLYDKRANFQVLSPRHRGEAGVTSLNQVLRLAINPSSSGIEEVRLGSSVVREGDRVMVVKNDNSRGVYNGDVGKVSRIDKRAKEIEIKIFEGVGNPDRLVRYSLKDAPRVLRLAYAQTVHKSQGQEYDVILLPLLPGFGKQLQRNLLYTAITRAKKKVFLIGKSSALASAVSNNQAEKRNSFLRDRLLLWGSGGS